VKLDRFSNVDFIGMQMVSLIFDSRPTFSELTARVRDELEWNSHEEVVPIEGVLQLGKMGQVYYRQLLRIASEVQWEKFVKTVKNNEIPGLDVVVRKLRTDPRPHVCLPLVIGVHRVVSSPQHKTFLHLMTLHQSETMQHICKIRLWSRMQNLPPMGLTSVLMMLLQHLWRFL